MTQDHVNYYPLLLKNHSCYIYPGKYKKLLDTIKYWSWRPSTTVHTITMEHPSKTVVHLKVVQ